MKINIFETAREQLEREGLLNSRNEKMLILDRAITIRKHLDDIEENKERTRFKKTA